MQTNDKKKILVLGGTGKTGRSWPVANLEVQHDPTSVFLAFVLFVATGSLLQAEPIPFFTVNLLILGFVLAEMVKYSAQLIYVRRGQ
ncbi:MAG: hypothetical protein AAF633_10125 [Chloroflexota bacterium]